MVGPPGSGLGGMEDWFQKLSAGGGNFVRIWLSTPFFDVEHARSGEFDPERAKRIDALLALARKYGIRLKLCTEHFRHLGEGSQTMGRQAAAPDRQRRAGQGHRRFLSRGSRPAPVQAEARLVRRPLRQRPDRLRLGAMERDERRPGQRLAPLVGGNAPRAAPPVPQEPRHAEPGELRPRSVARQLPRVVRAAGQRRAPGPPLPGPGGLVEDLPRAGGRVRGRGGGRAAVVRHPQAGPAGRERRGRAEPFGPVQALRQGPARGCCCTTSSSPRSLPARPARGISGTGTCTWTATTFGIISPGLRRLCAASTRRARRWSPSRCRTSG